MRLSELVRGQHAKIVDLNPEGLHGLDAREWENRLSRLQEVGLVEGVLVEIVWKGLSEASPRIVEVNGGQLALGHDEARCVHVERV